jgi:uncharacterized integral membrane protein
MKRRNGSDAAPTDDVALEVKRTRISATWVAVCVAVVFLVLLVVFISQNNRAVPVHFLWISGHVSEAVALVVAALAGAVLVLTVGAARVIQLRVVGRRHNRQLRKQQNSSSGVGVSSAGAGAPAQGVPGAEQAHQEADQAGP